MTFLCDSGARRIVKSGKKPKNVQYCKTVIKYPTIGRKIGVLPTPLPVTKRHMRSFFGYQTV